MKRSLSLMLSVLLLLLSCSAALGSASAEEPRIVLTFGDQTTRSGTHINVELGMWQYLEDLIGAEIQFKYMTQEEYAAGLASGDLPDIVATDKNLATILESGVALNADPYLEEYCPNLLQGEFLDTYQVFKQLGGEDGGFYFFPARIGYNGVGYNNETSQRGYIIRWDYYKELGYPPINNEDDYLNVLLQMYEKHPYTEDGYPTYLYGTESFLGYDTAFRTELSLDYWASYKYQNNMFTNEVYDGYVDTQHSQSWAAMKWQNKLYRAGKAIGAYDMELFTQTREQFRAKRARGQYLGVHATDPTFYRNSLKKDPDTLSGYNVVITPATNYYTNVYQLLGNGPGYMWFISANSPHVEEALKLFNCMADPNIAREIYYGRQGETWDYDEDGVPHMTEYGEEQMRAYDAGSTDPDNYYVRWGGANSLSSNLPLLRDNSAHPDGYPVGFATVSREYSIESMSNNISRDICEHYGVELPTDAFYKVGGLDFRNDCGEAIASCMSGLDRDQLRIISEADAIMESVQVELILAETDEEWQAIRDDTVRRLVELGEPEVFEAYKKMWNEAAAIIVPLVHQAQTRNGITPYTPDQYADYGKGWEVEAP